MAVNPYVIDDFRGGLCETALKSRNQSGDCRNVIARVMGLLEKRAGQERLNATALPGAVNGAHAYYQGAERYLIAASKGQAYQYDTLTKTFTSIKAGISATNPVQFVTCANYLVAFDGTTVPWKFNGLQVTDLANAPTGHLACLYREKLFTVTHDSPSELLWSDSFQPETWTPENFWMVGDGDGDKITAIRVYGAQNHLAVFKRRSVYALRGTNLDDFVLDGPLAEPGAVGPNAVVEHEGTLYYVADSGIYAYNGVTSINLTENRIPETWASLNKKPEVMAKAAAGQWNGLLWFSLPEDTAEYNTLVLVFDPQTGSFWPMSGIYASLFLGWDDGTGEVFLSGSSKDGYLVKQDTGLTDFGTAISAYWESPSFGAHDPARRKKLHRLTVVHEPEAGIDELLAMAVSATKEAQSNLPLTPIEDESDPLRQRYDFEDGTYAHQFRVKLSHSSAIQPMQVRMIQARVQAEVR